MTLDAVAEPRPLTSQGPRVFSVRVRDDGVALVTYDVPGEIGRAHV